MVRSPNGGFEVKLNCDNAGTLVPSYLDGELSEEQASPLRRHLLECPACREVAKDAKNLKQWFVADPAPDVPSGFAARVARRAFAGDPGVLEPQVAESEATILPFVLKVTAAAAAVLLVFALAIQVPDRPNSSELQADDMNGYMNDILELEEPPLEEPDEDEASEADGRRR